MAGPPHPPPPELALGILKNFNPFFVILMDSIHFKTDFNTKKKIFFLFTSFIPILFTVSKLYYTYYHLMLLMMVCIVLIWFSFDCSPGIQQPRCYIHVCRKIKNKINKLVFAPTPPPPFWSKANFFNFFFFLTLPLDHPGSLDAHEAIGATQYAHMPNLIFGFSYLLYQCTDYIKLMG